MPRKSSPGRFVSVSPCGNGESLKIYPDHCFPLRSTNITRWYLSTCRTRRALRFLAIHPGSTRLSRQMRVTSMLYGGSKVGPPRPFTAQLVFTPTTRIPFGQRERHPSDPTVEEAHLCQCRNNPQCLDHHQVRRQLYRLCVRLPSIVQNSGRSTFRICVHV